MEMNTLYREKTERIRMMDKTYVPFDKGTNQPYLVCDADSYNDQVWVFDDEAAGRKFCQEKADDLKAPVSLAVLKNDQILGFYSGLYALGINEVVLVETDETTMIPLEKLVLPPKYMQLPEEQRPISNPNLQLTGLYFMQELRRQVPNEEKPDLAALEEEMAANLVKSKFLIALQVEEEAEEGADGKKVRKVKVPCVKSPKGDAFQPVFTDPAELKKFSRDKQYQVSNMPFADLQKLMNDELKGIVVNPMGMNMVILKEKIPMLCKRFPQDEAK